MYKIGPELDLLLNKNKLAGNKIVDNIRRKATISSWFNKRKKILPCLYILHLERTEQITKIGGDLFYFGNVSCTSFSSLTRQWISQTLLIPASPHRTCKNLAQPTLHPNYFHRFLQRGDFQMHWTSGKSAECLGDIPARLGTKGQGPSGRLGRENALSRLA